MNEISRTNNSIKNVITAYSVQILTVIIGIVSRTVFMKTLGEDFLGINGLFTSALMVLSLSEFGIGDAIVYRLLHLFAERKKQEIVCVFEFSKKIYRFLIVATLILGYVIMPLVFSTIKLENSIEHLKLYYYIFVINIALTYLSSPYSQVFKADQKERVTVKGTFISQTIIYLLQILSLFLWKQYIIYLLLMLMQNVVLYVYFRVKYQQHYGYLNGVVGEKISRDDKKDIISITKDMFIGKMAAASIASVDNLTISYFVNTTMVGRYSNYVLIFDVIKRIAKLLYNAIYSSIGEINVKEDGRTRLKFFKIENYLFFYIATILVTGACVLTNPLIQLWFGAQHLVEQKIVIIVCVDIYLGIMTYGIENFANTSELYKKTKKSYFKMAICNCILSVMLGMRYGMFGILLATAISRIIYYIEVPKFVINELFDWSLMKYYMDLMAKSCITIINISVAYMVVQGLQIENSIYSFILEMIIVLVISSVILEIFSIKNKEHAFIRSKFINIIRSKYNEFYK